MKTNSVTTNPFRILNLTPQTVKMGDNVDVYNALTQKVSFSGVVSYLAVLENGKIWATIVEKSGVIHDQNSLQSAIVIN